VKERKNSEKEKEKYMEKVENKKGERWTHLQLACKARKRVRVRPWWTRSVRSFA
jgi:hypothetical protein